MLVTDNGLSRVTEHSWKLKTSTTSKNIKNIDMYDHKAEWLEINVKIWKLKKEILMDNSWVKRKIQTEFVGFLENNHSQNIMNLKL